MFKEVEQQSPHHVVIVGGGFGGLYAAQTLAKAPVKVTLIDKRNFHVFQPLLYQVATGGLSPGDISSPIRAVLNRNKNTEVLMGEVISIDPKQQTVKLRHREIKYDSLILATGVSHQYFGKDEWADKAPGLKTVEDALEMRRRIFIAFESAEKETNVEKRKAWLTFVLVGGGPAGVELAGALGELAHGTLKEDFRNIDTSKAEIILVQSPDRILPTYPPHLSAKAQQSLESLGVTVRTGTKVINIENNLVTVRQGDIVEQIPTRTILWAAGMKASGMANILSECTGAELDRGGRVIVNPEFKVPEYDNIFVIGDLANYSHQDGKPLPGVAPVAMQAGQYVGHLIRKQLKGKTMRPFHYFDWGSLAVIGKHAAVVDFGFIKFSGFLAWIVWMFIHVFYLIEFDNQLIVMIQWAWSYFTRSKGARLITTPGEHPIIQLEDDTDVQEPVKV
ncbi:MAG: NAD(P)/FAD-dependent oxidoreductase [Symploca sp. SIO3C6]|uniref:NADH:ubiquinone reductase (non-electrogenic) n=1 Tax=Symploca sp. SIO1C4 TaxID=2607765 RepID=A0A6B3NDG5_9CYAN|nr:NAD(P)/FAD-dependent oxidoreductase [Symploca sp. SIO3C6]NER29630.1 NAD(P)/FAD-dependent oxidoreductase [Symploca sp. SIO1C4]NET03570.1 NAD(P)/FAD-dependent oxidoreductase [Symploca sp. SIO2B6]